MCFERGSFSSVSSLRCHISVSSVFISQWDNTQERMGCVQDISFRLSVSFLPNLESWWIDSDLMHYLLRITFHLPTKFFFPFRSMNNVNTLLFVDKHTLHCKTAQHGSRVLEIFADMCETVVKESSFRQLFRGNTALLHFQQALW